MSANKLWSKAEKYKNYTLWSRADSKNPGKLLWNATTNARENPPMTEEGFPLDEIKLSCDMADFI